MKFTHPFKAGLSILSLSAMVSMAACVKKSEGVDSEVMWAVSGSSSAEIEKALQSKIAFRLNLKTNRATMYKDGVAVDQWNIASADVTGQWHDGRPQYTPTGVFNVEDLQMCPAWYPRNPINPATGRVVASEQERMRVFAENPQVYGACGSRNPLGKYVLWFNGAYGMHGNSAEEILEFDNPEDRRVSGGCIRNPNAKIKSVFHTVLDTFGELSNFSGQVTSMESRSMNSRYTITKGVSNLNMRVVVGNWGADPSIGSRIARPAQPPAPVPVVTQKPADPIQTPVATPEPTKAPVPQPAPLELTNPKPNPTTISGKMSCRIISVESASGIAPVYMNVPVAGGENRVSTFYRLGWPVTVFEKVEGTSFYKVSRGYLDQKYVSDCSSDI